ARDNFAKRGSEDVLKDALVQVVGADLQINTIVDGSAGGRGRGGQPTTPKPPSGSPAPQTRSTPHDESTPTPVADQPPTSTAGPQAPAPERPVPPPSDRA